MFAAKVNANFPGNPDRYGLPTIQGVIALFDAADGRVLALLDSIEITSVRTAAATAVAAKHLAPDGATVTICGCGEQSRNQLRALRWVRSVKRVMAFDVDAGRAQRFAEDMTAEAGLQVEVVRALEAAAGETGIWVRRTSGSISTIFGVGSGRWSVSTRSWERCGPATSAPGYSNQSGAIVLNALSQRSASNASRNTRTVCGEPARRTSKVLAIQNTPRRHPSAKRGKTFRNAPGGQFLDREVTDEADRVTLRESYQLPPPAPCWSVCSARSMLKLPGFWLGGNSLKVARNLPTYCCAGTSKKTRSTRQRS
jgi:hypothetical protein